MQCRRCPRWRGPCRLRSQHPQSERRWWPHPRQSRQGSGADGGRSLGKAWALAKGVKKETKVSKRSIEGACPELRSVASPPSHTAPAEARLIGVHHGKWMGRDGPGAGGLGGRSRGHVCAWLPGRQIIDMKALSKKYTRFRMSATKGNPGGHDPQTATRRGRNRGARAPSPAQTFSRRQESRTISRGGGTIWVGLVPSNSCNTACAASRPMS